VAKVLDRLGRPVDARSLEGEAQERAFLDRADRTLLLIDLQLEMGLKKAPDTGFDAVPGPLAFDDNEKIVALACEPVSASFQFLVQII
jgi:hypothetical protein